MIFFGVFFNQYLRKPATAVIPAVRVVVTIIGSKFMWPINDLMKDKASVIEVGKPEVGLEEFFC